MIRVSGRDSPCQKFVDLLRTQAQRLVGVPGQLHGYFSLLAPILPGHILDPVYITGQISEIIDLALGIIRSELCIFPDIGRHLLFCVAVALHLNGEGVLPVSNSSLESNRSR